MKFLIINQFASDNLGDKLINQKMCEGISNIGHSYISAAFSGPSQTQEDLTDNLNPLSKISSFFKQSCPFFIKYLLRYNSLLRKTQSSKELIDCNAIIIGGGQLFKHHSIFVYCMYNWLKYAQKNKKPLAIYGIGIDNNLNLFERLVYKRAFRQAVYINVRDNNSAQLIKNYYGITCAVSPDIAFTYVPPILEHSPHHKILFMPYNYQTAVKYLGLRTSKNKYFEELLSLLLCNTESDNRNKIILSSTTSEDYLECLHFQNFLYRHNVNSICQPSYEIDHFVALLQECSCIITGRMHAMILARICEKKIIPLQLSNKIDGFTREYLSHSIELSTLHNAALSGLCDCINTLIQFSTQNHVL